MAQPNVPFLIGLKSQGAVVEFAKQCTTMMSQQWNLRDQLKKIDLAYLREQDQSEEHWRARKANRYGDRSRFQNITVPVVMPQVEAAVTYQSSVFLTGNPLFGVVSNPANIDAALQLETVIDNQATMGGWVRQLILAFRDGFKYNLMATEVSWKQVVVADLETDLSWNAKVARPKEAIWAGNFCTRLNPYNLLLDTRVLPSEVHKKGDFAGYVELMSRIQLKSFIASLQNHLVDNVKAAFETGIGSAPGASSSTAANYYTPQLNPEALITLDPRTSTNWLSWAGLTNANQGIQYKDMYEVVTLYARILPADFAFSVPARNTPQIWKFVIVNNQVVIQAERQTNAHDYLPILVAQPLEDGLGYQTKSLADNVSPVQDITSAMWNSIIAARRRAISDRGIYDPSRITAAHINNENPSAKIPVRPAAYGKPVQDAYYPIPFRDEQSGVLMQETQSLLSMANMISGQNPARQGQFVKGNKTRDEFQTVMNNANGRDQLTAMVLEYQFFTPLKEMVKINIMQYQGATTLYSASKEKEVSIDPIKLRETVMQFKVSDGLIPSEKLISGETFSTALQVIGASPQINTQYNIGPMFSYLMKTQGADLRPFEKPPEQLAFESAMATWQQTVMEIAKTAPGTPLPAQPVPAAYGYVPQGATAPAGSEQQPQVNNITNNITNNKAA